jgi:hypothetical protein
MSILLVGAGSWIAGGLNNTENSSLKPGGLESNEGSDAVIPSAIGSNSTSERKPVSALLRGVELSEIQRFSKEFSTAALSRTQGAHSFAEDSDFFVDYLQNLDTDTRKVILSWLEEELFPTLQSIEDGKSESFLFGEDNAFVQLPPFSDEELVKVVSIADIFATQLLAEANIDGEELGKYLRLITGYVGLNRLARASVQNTRSGERDVVAFHTFADLDDRIMLDGSGAITVPTHTKFISADSSSVLGKRAAHLFGFSEPPLESEQQATDDEKGAQ